MYAVFVNRARHVLFFFLIAPLPAQQAPFFPLNPVQIFPNLLYGPDVWSLVRLRNPSALPKSARVELYRGDGEVMKSESRVVLSPGQSIDIRIEEPTTGNRLSWARIQDVSKNKSGQPLEVSARVEKVSGNQLEDFPAYASRPDRAGHWLSPASAVSNRNLFFLNISGTPTVLEICSVNIHPRCAADGEKPLRTAVKPGQSIILKIGSLKKRSLSIRSAPGVTSVIGLMQPEMPSTREYSSESSVSFDEPSRQQ